MSPPNFLLIMTDQQRYDSLACNGNPLIETPNWDRLAARGVRFTQAYTQCPVCVPARMNLMTGHYGHTLNLTSNGPVPGPEVPTLAGLLTAGGYFTQAIGKMHFSPPRNHMGFQRMWLSEEMPRYRQDDEFLMYLEEQGFGHVEEPHGQRHELYYQPQVSVLPAEHHTTAWTGRRTVEFLEQNRNRQFFCFTSFIKPHPPWEPCVPYDGMYPEDQVPMPVRREEERDPLDAFLLRQNHSKGMDNPSDEITRRVRARYYGMVSQIDAAIGEILDALDDLGLTENTLVLFTSDHGDLLGDHYAWGKRCFYEGPVHVPFIVSWPGRFPEGERRDHFVSHCDILPTFLAQAGEHAPEVPGEDLTPVLHDPAAPWREYTTSEFGRDRTAKFMVRRGDWKYIYLANGRREQLFDLQTDPDELNNVAGDAPEVLQELRDILLTHYALEDWDGAVVGDDLIGFDFEPLDLGGENRQFPIWPRNLPERA